MHFLGIPEKGRTIEGRLLVSIFSRLNVVGITHQQRLQTYCNSMQCSWQHLPSHEGSAEFVWGFLERALFVVVVVEHTGFQG